MGAHIIHADFNVLCINESGLSECILSVQKLYLYVEHVFYTVGKSTLET